MVDFSFESAQDHNGFVIQREPVQEHGIITRKEFLIVFEHNKIVCRYLRIGGIGVFDVDRSVGERGITEGVIDSSHVLWTQPIGDGHELPAILPIQKFVSESELQLRMFLQIANGANAQRPRTIAPHNERVGVVEPERLRHPDPEFSQLSDDEIDLHRITSLQNLLHDGAGVFGIDIDLSAAERFPKNNGAAHALAVFCGNSGFG